MPEFSRLNGLYGISVVTGPRWLVLRLEFLEERNDDFEVAASAVDGLYRKPDPAKVRACVLEGTDAANKQYGTSLHPWLARYSGDALNDNCTMFRDAAFAIVERLAQRGEAGYEGTV